MTIEECKVLKYMKSSDGWFCRMWFKNEETEKYAMNHLNDGFVEITDIEYFRAVSVISRNPRPLRDKQTAEIVGFFEEYQAN